MGPAFIFVFTLFIQLLGVSGQATSSWDRPNDRPLSGVDLQSYDCGDDGAQNIQQGIEADRKIYGDVPFDDSFYRTADDFDPESSKPGDVLKLRSYISESKSWGLPGGATLYHMQYVTITQDKRKVPATAFVVLPFANRLDNKPFPILAYAHGTIGTFYGCPPSSSYNLFDYDTWKQFYFDGYAIVAADYAGLGNNYTAHHYLASTLAAGDAYYSVIAAKRAFGSALSNRWASAGHSQGGGTVWALVESEYVTSSAPLAQEISLEFVGGVSLSPAPRFADIVKSLVQQNQTTMLCAYAPFFYAALDSVEPGSAAEIFTPIMLKRIALGQEIGVCGTSGAALGLDLCDTGEVYRNLTSVPAYPPLLAFQSEYGAAIGRTAKAPMLVVQSDGDKTVPWEVTVEAWKTTCKAGGFPVELSMYPALDHSATPDASSSEWLGWLRERFDGKSGARCCEMRDYTATDKAAAWLPSG